MKKKFLGVILAFSALFLIVGCQKKLTMKELGTEFNYIQDQYYPIVTKVSFDDKFDYDKTQKQIDKSIENISDKQEELDKNKSYPDATKSVKKFAKESIESLKLTKKLLKLQKDDKQDPKLEKKAFSVSYDGSKTSAQLMKKYKWKESKGLKKFNKESKEFQDAIKGYLNDLSEAIGNGEITEDEAKQLMEDSLLSGE